MNNIYLVQANAVYGDTVKNTYFPYAAGCLAAYAFSNEIVKSGYELKKFIYTRIPPEQVISSLDTPYLVGFSCCVWNNEYNKKLSSEIKKAFPDCITVFGGHQIPPDAEKAFAEYPDADILIHGGGEEAFCDILLSFLGEKKLETIPNISVRELNGKMYDGERISPVTPDYPSPYLTGVFDEILKDDISFSAIVETNRGCPNRCAFCDWGELKSKVRQFSLEKVYSEFEWLSAHRIEYVYIADANFGLFDRDEDITDKLVSLKSATGYPNRIKVNFTKNRFDVVGSISRKFAAADMGKSQTISFQSLNPQTLVAIGRTNLTLEHFGSLLKLYSKENIPTYSEVILGLPLETYESFTAGLCALIENGQHTSTNMYPCELLPNSRLGSDEFIERYQIKTTKLPFEQFHCPKNSNEDITEYSYLITSTSTMGTKDWVEAYFFSTVVLACHFLGFLKESAIVLRNRYNISYKSFYSELIDFAYSGNAPELEAIFQKMHSHIEGISSASNATGIYDERFGIISYEPDEYLFASLCFKSDLIKPEINNFISKLTKDIEFSNSLTCYQFSILYLPNKDITEIKPGYNFPEFIHSVLDGEITDLSESDNSYSLAPPKKVGSFSDYVRECVWFGRRNNGMKMNISYTDNKV